MLEFTEHHSRLPCAPGDLGEGSQWSEQRRRGRKMEVRFCGRLLCLAALFTVLCVASVFGKHVKGIVNTKEVRICFLTFITGNTTATTDTYDTVVGTGSEGMVATQVSAVRFSAVPGQVDSDISAAICDRVHLSNTKAALGICILSVCVSYAPNHLRYSFSF